MSKASPSELKLRWRRFKQIKRGYWSLIILSLLAGFCLLDQCVVGKRALMVIYDGQVYFPAFAQHTYAGKTFGAVGNAAEAEADYRALHNQVAEVSDSSGRVTFVHMPLIPYSASGDVAEPIAAPLSFSADGKYLLDPAGGPYSGTATQLYSESPPIPHIRFRYLHGVKEGLALGWNAQRDAVFTATYLQGKLTHQHYTGQQSINEFLFATPPQELYQILYHPMPPLTGGHLLGTNSQGTDILAYLIGGFQVVFKAILLYIPLVYGVGISLGLMMGYFGGRVDVVAQRFIEVFSQIPFLFVIMILADLVPAEWKGLVLILGLLTLFGWMGISYQIRTSTLKEKTRDYIAAARTMGGSTLWIMRKHLLPNLVAVIVTLVPFSISGLILALASLDYIGFGLPLSYPSWGRLLNDGLNNLSSPWIVTAAFSVLTLTLILITFIGEAIRESFDPKTVSLYK